jgi:hypothetical protein
MDREGNVMEDYDGGGPLVRSITQDIKSQAGEDFGLEKRLKDLWPLR